MLIYHPAYDAHHCVFRMLAVAEICKDVEVDKARLLDFYLLFPASVALIRLPADLRNGRKAAKNIENPYHDPLNPFATFRDMRLIQEVALKCIAASGLIDVNKLGSGFVVRTDKDIPEMLQNSIKGFLDARQPLADFILQDLSKIPLRGHDGLKHRSEMMEYKYDVA
jgi:hypothetical protein